LREERRGRMGGQERGGEGAGKRKGGEQRKR